MSESSEQIKVIDWFSVAYPSIAHMLMSYPSGFIAGGKNKFGVINKMKREGWRKGVPDLMLMIPVDGYCGMVIEMKDLKKTQCSLSNDQKFYLDQFSEYGYRSVWCAGSESAISEIECYLGNYHREVRV